MKRIAINLDAICTPISNSIAEEEIKYCKLRHLSIPEYIQDLKEEGNYIIIYTSRNPVLYLATKEWLRKEEIVYDEIQMSKPEFDVLFDNTIEVKKLFPEGEKGR